jgi:hypothetical protein
MQLCIKFQNVLFLIMTSVWPVSLAQVLPRPQLIFPPFQNHVFWNLFEFSVVEIT